jgi:hypothetical protein
MTLPFFTSRAGWVWISVCTGLALYATSTKCMTTTGPLRYALLLECTPLLLVC